MKLRKLTLAVVALTALALAGCASTTPPAITPPTIEPDFAAQIVISEPVLGGDFEHENTFTLISPTEGALIVGGSGSCAPVFSGGVYEDNKLTLSIDNGAYANMACTADFTLYTYNVEVTDGTFDSRLIASLTDGENVTELTVITE